MGKKTDKIRESIHLAEWVSLDHLRPDNERLEIEESLKRAFADIQTPNTPWKGKKKGG